MMDKESLLYGLVLCMLVSAIALSIVTYKSGEHDGRISGYKEALQDFQYIKKEQ